MKLLVVLLLSSTADYNQTGVAINDTLTALSAGHDIDALFDPAFSRLVAGRPGGESVRGVAALRGAPIISGT